MSSSVYFNFPPGYASLVYVVILDLIIISAIDDALLVITNAWWYKRMKAGIPLEVKAVGIPGMLSLSTLTLYPSIQPSQ